MGLRRSLMAVVLVAAPAWTCSVALGQSATLPTEVVMSSASLTPAQQNQINQFVVRSVELLLSNEPASVSQGRRQLLDTFTLPGISEMFLASYSPAISRELNGRNALEHESVLVRTNAMIVASRLSDGGVVSLIRQGLTDKNEGVRYWAAVTAANAGPKLSQADQQVIQTVLSNIWQQEKSIDVLEKMLVAMDALRTPQSSMLLLQALNHRVMLHVADPSLPIKAELEGLQGVTVRTFSALTAPGQSVEPQVLKQLVIVLFRYFDLATALQANQATPQAHLEDLRTITRLAGNFLPRLAARLDVTLTSRQVNPADVNANRLLAEEWRRALTTSAAGISTGDLSIPPPPAPATAPAASPQP